ncbi:MAG: serine/threonine-protein phosphatase [Ruminococcus sp.]|nr:serine/threonine-protein phosphatase [Ruminococcus sp.]
MKAEHSIFTDRGGRPVNEDCADAVRAGSRYCFILCDGLGGHGMGDKASKLVTESLKSYFTSCGSIEEFAADALQRAQAALLAAQRTDPRLRQMRTTAVVLCIDGSRGIALHIGDSRLYRFRGGRVLTRTRDHSIPQVLFMTGEITEQEIRSHPDRNKLLRALGDDTDEVRSERTDFEVAAGDAFLLCSDGFWEPVTEEEMERLLKENCKTAKWLSAMGKQALKNGKGKDMDNCTAVAVTIRE